ncbi:MAG: indolepyruvate oxidoreductase subunit beta [candidate division NC10 bacterium]|nr:indolepyruvate oxidoreductase subunit beta [candidate division NC10 bacterium]
MGRGVHNILIAGVGGQGVLLASEILAKAALHAGLEVKKSEIHGMAQRGGVVTSHVRYGQRVYSPLIPAGEADIVLAFEEAEALRWAPTLTEGGVLLVNRQRILPPLVTLGLAEYPEDVPLLLSKLDKRYQEVKAYSLAQEMGDLRLINTIMLGALSAYLRIPLTSWKKSLTEELPASVRDLNQAAFRRGRRAVPAAKKASRAARSLT